jgi:ATP-dependent DNA helicase PIF1
MELSTEQTRALDLFKAGYNLFLTGPGGTGKTYIIRLMNAWANMQGKKIQVCALTGCAAALLKCKAKTIHSWSGIGMANGTEAEIVKRVVGKKYKKAALKAVDILIVDEVSMMSRKLFELLDRLLKVARRCFEEPFGGVQLVFVGDFYQLPPVGDTDEPETCQFCFESELWKQTFEKYVELTQTYRHPDPVFAKVINQIRVGKIKRSGYNLLMSRVGIEIDGDIRPTVLMPIRRTVDAINKAEMKKLHGAEKQTYTAEMSIDAEARTADKGRNLSEDVIEMEYEQIRRNLIVDSTIDLCIGALVMCVANLDLESEAPIVNGSQGIIEAFNGGWPIVRFRNSTRRSITVHVWQSENIPWLGVKQIPLIHAWAMTIHKAQGGTLEMAQIDAGKSIFESGQTYVALSRVKSLDGLCLTALDPSKIKVSKKVQKFYADLLVENIE